MLPTLTLQWSQPANAAWLEMELMASSGGSVINKVRLNGFLTSLAINFYVDVEDGCELLHL